MVCQMVYGFSDTSNYNFLTIFTPHFGSETVSIGSGGHVIQFQVNCDLLPSSLRASFFL